MANTSPASAGKPLRSVPKGVMHVPVTPFKGDLSVDYATFEKLVDWHVRQKPSSLCVVLHIAESVSLAKD
jgi:dihydrodipicolinate synthase/N-acetylneuraminate lyase